jgi:hypothetical protein
MPFWRMAHGVWQIFGEVECWFGEFFAKRRAPASFRLEKKFGEIDPKCYLIFFVDVDDVMDGHPEDDVDRQRRVRHGPDRPLVVGEQVLGQAVLVLVAYHCKYIIDIL